MWIALSRQLQVAKLLSDSKSFQSITLIDVESYATYCGVIPCSLAPCITPASSMEGVQHSNEEGISIGHDREDSTAIDLQYFCYLHNIQFVNDGVVDIDPWKQVLYLTETQQPLSYDILSLDIGTATKSLEAVPGAFDYAIPIRPMHELESRLKLAETQELRAISLATPNKEEAITEDSDSKLVHLVVVGDGALSIELALCMEARWRPLLGDNLRVVLVTSESTLLPEPNARKILKSILMERNITLCFHASVDEVLEDRLCLDNGMEIPFSYCLWATGGEPHDIIKTLVQQRRGLEITEEGWISVTDALQSTSHPNVFAAGDCCSSASLTLPKASGGIHTLQEGPILAHNLEHYALHQRLETMPQQKLGCGLEAAASGGSMQFISCGDGTAIGFAFGIPMRGRFVWQIKNAMNQEFFALIKGDVTPASTSSVSNNEQQLPSPSSAAAMFRGINVENYRLAWATLQYMTKHAHYRAEVLKHYVRQDEGGSAGDAEIGGPAVQQSHQHQQYCRDDKIVKGPHPHQTAA